MGQRTRKREPNGDSERSSMRAGSRESEKLEGLAAVRSSRVRRLAGSCKGVFNPPGRLPVACARLGVGKPEAFGGKRRASGGGDARGGVGKRACLGSNESLSTSC